MNIIIPMAGMGKRLRPHTLTLPKPLLPVAGKPIVHHLVEDIGRLFQGSIRQIGFVTGRFGGEVEAGLMRVAESVGAQGRIYYQEEPLGTAHAVLCAEPMLEGPIFIAFADTLFRTDDQVMTDKDGVIWVQKVDDPRSFGVVTLNPNGDIADMVEKPENFVSDLAIVGVYYLRDGGRLKEEIHSLIARGQKSKGEYQLTDCLRAMLKWGAKIGAGKVNRWMDCGNKAAILDTNRYLLSERPLDVVNARGLSAKDSVVIPPCYIGEGVVLECAVVGPYVSLGNGAKVSRSTLRNSVVRDHSRIENAVIDDALVGSNAVVAPAPLSLDLGDFSKI